MKKLILSLSLVLASTFLASPAMAELTALNPAAISVCNLYNQISNRQSCLTEIGRLQFSEAAIRVCNQYSQIQNRQTCMLDLGNLRIDQSAQSLCTQYNQIHNQQLCMKDLGNMAFAPAAVSLCNQYNELRNRQMCLRSLANLAFDQAAVSLCNQYNELSNRLNCMRELGIQSFDSMIENVRTCEEFAQASADLRQRFSTADAVNAEIIREAYSKLQVKFAICLPASTTVGSGGQSATGTN